MSMVGSTASLGSSFLPSARAAGGLAPGLLFPMWKLYYSSWTKPYSSRTEPGKGTVQGKVHSGSEDASLLCVPHVSIGGRGVGDQTFRAAGGQACLQHAAHLASTPGQGRSLLTD